MALWAGKGLHPRLKPDCTSAESGPHGELMSDSCLFRSPSGLHCLCACPPVGEAWVFYPGQLHLEKTVQPLIHPERKNESMSPAAISFVFHLWIFKSHYEARTNPCQPASYPSGSFLNISLCAVSLCSSLTEFLSSGSGPALEITKQILATPPRGKKRS